MKEKSTILIIEDDKDIAGMIRLILEHKGYTAIHLPNPERVREVLTNNNVDVIIMDMLLSGINGTDICRAIRKDNSFARIPVIMMSAHPDAESICRTAGADDFVSKPFDMDGLMSKIARFAGKKLS